jgi:hypothetical protein
MLFATFTINLSLSSFLAFFPVFATHKMLPSFIYLFLIFLFYLFAYIDFVVAYKWRISCESSRVCFVCKTYKVVMMMCNRRPWKTGPGSQRNNILSDAAWNIQFLYLPADLRDLRESRDDTVS